MPAGAVVVFGGVDSDGVASLGVEVELPSVFGVFVDSVLELSGVLPASPMPPG